MRMKSVVTLSLAGVLALTGAVAASASPVSSSIETQAVSINASTITVIRDYDASIYQWLSDTPDKIWYDNGSGQAGWLYRTDGYQSGGRWYVQYTGTIYPYE